MHGRPPPISVRRSISTSISCAYHRSVSTAPIFASTSWDAPTDRADYSEFLTFVQPPVVSVAYRANGGRAVTFDAGDSAVVNPGAEIVNVQWGLRPRRETFHRYTGLFVPEGQRQEQEAAASRNAQVRSHGLIHYRLPRAGQPRRRGNVDRRGLGAIADVQRVQPLRGRVPAVGEERLSQRQDGDAGLRPAPQRSGGRRQAP